MIQHKKILVYVFRILESFFSFFHTQSYPDVSAILTWSSHCQVVPYMSLQYVLLSFGHCTVVVSTTCQGTSLSIIPKIQVIIQ